MATKKTAKVNKDSSESSEIITPTTNETVVNSKKSFNTKFLRQVLLVLIIGSLAFFLARRYRGLIIAATVNSTPISRIELNQKLNERYGKSVLDEMVNTALIKDLARQNDITVTEEDVKSERQKIVDNLGGEEALNTTLEQYGMTSTEFEERLKSVSLERKLSDKLFPVEISDADAQKFYEDNKDAMGGKSFEELKADIVDNLKQQKQQQQFSDWFKQEKDKAKIQTFI